MIAKLELTLRTAFAKYRDKTQNSLASRLKSLRTRMVESKLNTLGLGDQFKSLKLISHTKPRLNVVYATKMCALVAGRLDILIDMLHCAVVLEQDTFILA